jgi:ABC-type transport system involved in multi-copper enzyme maturation permease subunit
MYRLSVIARYTFLEAIMQPIYALLMSLGTLTLIIYGLLPFFTLGDDTKMYKSVGLDVIMLVVLLATLFTTSKSIYEEIEDRTMLTLMSKPVRRWEVLIGKYVGIIFASALGVAILGIILLGMTWYRVPADHYLTASSLNDLVQAKIYAWRMSDIAGIAPQLVLTWLQISVLAAVGVVLSTRFSLVVNLPTVIILYLAGNLTRYLFPIATGPLADKSPMLKGFAWLISLVIPYLGTFDLKGLTVLSTIKIASAASDEDRTAIPLSMLWSYVGIAGLNAIAYVTFALCAGLWSFRSRELGGGEG